jgi:hypothetical protein
MRRAADGSAKRMIKSAVIELCVLVPPAVAIVMLETTCHMSRLLCWVLDTRGRWALPRSLLLGF